MGEKKRGGGDLRWTRVPGTGPEVRSDLLYGGGSAAESQARLPRQAKEERALLEFPRAGTELRT